MKCPLCNVDLMMSERQGIEIDYCPQCRGVWLDRGELEKLVGMAREPEQEAPRPQHYNSAPPRDDYRRDYERRDDDRRHYDDDDYKRRHGYKKRRGLDIFDIFD